jgi:hypothetical protein
VLDILQEEQLELVTATDIGFQRINKLRLLKNEFLRRHPEGCMPTDQEVLRPVHLLIRGLKRKPVI